MRNKIVLIKGFANISQEITNAEFERINADHVVVMAALRKPQLLPEKFKSMQLTLIEYGVIEILKHWKQIEQEHLIAAEYAQIVVEHGKEDIKCVEGNSLHVSWFYETIRAIHRQFNQIIIDVEIETGWFDDIRVRIDETLYKKYEAINLLNPDKWKG